MSFFLTTQSAHKFCQRSFYNTPWNHGNPRYSNIIGKRLSSGNAVVSSRVVLTTRSGQCSLDGRTDPKSKNPRHEKKCCGHVKNVCSILFLIINNNNASTFSSLYTEYRPSTSFRKSKYRFAKSVDTPKVTCYKTHSSIYIVLFFMI